MSFLWIKLCVFLLLYYDTFRNVFAMSVSFQYSFFMFLFVDLNTEHVRESSIPMQFMQATSDETVKITDLSFNHFMSMKKKSNTL